MGLQIYNFAQGAKILFYSTVSSKGSFTYHVHIIEWMWSKFLNHLQQKKIFILRGWGRKTVFATLRKKVKNPQT